MIKIRLHHDELGQLLRTLRLGVEPSDLHGSLSGFLCGGGQSGEDAWLAALELDQDAVTGRYPEPLQRFYRECRAQFGQLPACVDPLLPESAAAIQRGAALVEWCRGFLGGFGLSGAARRRTLSEDATEILADFATIAGTRVEVSDDREDERALADVIDFVRTGAAALFRETQLGAATRSLH